MDGLWRAVEPGDWLSDRGSSRAGSGGLLGSTCEHTLARELKLHGIVFRLQHPQPVECKGIPLDCGWRVDASTFGCDLFFPSAISPLLDLVPIDGGTLECGQ